MVLDIFECVVIFVWEIFGCLKGKGKGKVLRFGYVIIVVVGFFNSIDYSCIYCVMVLVVGVGSEDYEDYIVFDEGYWDMEVVYNLVE